MKNLKFCLIGLIFTLITPHFIHAQEVDKIIAKHLEAHGGIKKLEGVKALKISGKFTAFSEEKTFWAIKTNISTYYGEYEVGKFKVTESFKTNTGWTIDPWWDIPYARQLTAGESNIFAQKAELFTPFFKYKEKGYKVEYKGTEKIDGMDAHVIILTRKNGKEEKWFLSSKTYLEYKCESDWEDFGMPCKGETFFDDFREVDGIIYPFYIERIYSQRNRMMEIEKVELNPEFKKDLFEMPRLKEMEKLAAFEGEWMVKVEAIGRNGKWNIVDETTASIKFVSTNLLQEKIKYEYYGLPFSKQISFSYHNPNKKYRVVVFDELGASTNIFQGNFADKIFVVDNTEISFDTNEKSKQYQKMEINNIEKDSFVVEEKSSADKGKTWRSMLRYNYTRKK